jgi:hypothetical protein
MEIENIRKVLKQFSQFLEDNLKDGIINQNLLKSGKLANSVQVKYEDDEKEPRFKISMENYGFYQDSGISGIKVRQPSNPESLFTPGQFKSDVIGGPLPFVVRKSIAQKGFRPRPFIIPSVNRTINSLEDKLIEAGEEDINEEILDIFKVNGAIV